MAFTRDIYTIHRRIGIYSLDFLLPVFDYAFTRGLNNIRSLLNPIDCNRDYNWLEARITPSQYTDFGWSIGVIASRLLAKKNPGDGSNMRDMCEMHQIYISGNY